MSDAREYPSSDELLDRFLARASESGLTLYPAQEEAMLELYAGKNVILNTPTGSGKSLVAASLHHLSLGQGRRSVYTCPIKALVNEKFLSLCREFGPEQVGMVTGDGSVNRDARILCCTAEILANMALRDGDLAPVDDVIMDEFHYYSDRDRGVAWQIPLLTLRHARFLLMSATLGETDFFEKELTRLNGRETVTIKSTERPVPLDFRYSEDPIHEAIGKLIREGRAPIYIVNFSQASAAEVAQDLLSTDFCTKEEKKAISEALSGERFQSPYGKDIQRLLKHGVGLHHAGLLPRYRILVERLAQKGLLKLICGTDTLGVGVNVPIRTVLFTKLCKFDGQKTVLLSVRDFQQIAGRAGRKGFDDLGTVVAQAPEHVIENLSNERKAAGDPKKLKKLVKRKPPEKGYVPWDKSTFERLSKGQPEQLVSRFDVTHSMLLNVLGRPLPEGDTGRANVEAMRALIRDSHEPPGTQKRLVKKAFVLARSLVERGIIELKPHLRVNVDLQEDFSLNHALSLYLLDTLKLLDPQDPGYALDALTLCESILENPEMVLRKQLDRIKGEKIQELKAQGMEYDERMEELEKLEYPKPRREFVYDTFNAFAARHPWVGQENIRPKSVAREMYETFSSFGEYIRDYELQRSEGQLLRYLSDVYKTLVQNVPEPAKDAAPDDSVRLIEEYLATLIRGVDSSLLDEWEKLRNPGWAPKPADAAEPGAGGMDASGPPDITRDPRALTIAIRNESFRLVRALSRGDWETALGLIEPEGDGESGQGVRWSVEELEKRMQAHRAEHGPVLTDGRARDPKRIAITRGADAWRAEQILTTQAAADADPDDPLPGDWVLRLTIPLEAARQAGHPRLRLESIGSI
jgi:superfamily II RNA helicase